MSSTTRPQSTLADDACRLAAQHALTMLNLDWIPDGRPAQLVVDVALLTAVRRLRVELERRESALRERLAREGVDEDTIARALGVDEGAERKWRRGRGLTRPESARVA